MSPMAVDFGVFGFLPQHDYSLYFPAAALLMWAIFLPIALIKRVKIFYNASVKAAFFEEILFRGLVYGLVLHFTKSALYAVLISSVLFGLFHLRNLWWATWRRSWAMTVYAGVTAGPVFALIRFFTGDIYLGILVHFVHNFFVIMLPGRYGVRTPQDDEIKAVRIDKSAKVGR